MKKIITAILAVLALGFATQTQAQTKFAHVDYAEVIDSIPSVMAAEAEINKFRQSGQKTLADMEKALQAEYDLYLAEKPTLSTVMIELREKSLMEQQQLIEYKAQSLENDLMILNERLFKPIEDNLTKAIEIVAERHKVTYIFEKTTLLYTAPAGGLDLTKEVKAELMKLETQRTTTTTTGGN